MTAPWRPAEPLTDETFAHVRRRAIFDCCKWDPQVEDTSTIANVPLVLTGETWRELTALAESLAREALAAEEELLGRPELHAALGIPRRVAGALARAGDAPAVGAARIVRFDFHHTSAGWRISEANTDVPGGLNEASGLSALVAPHYRSVSPAGDAAGAYARAVAAALPAGGHVALVHATAYTDDRQVMAYVARRIAEHGARASLVSPSHLRWRGGRARVESEWATGPVDAVVRFFPAEWLPNLPAACGWTSFFRGAATPVSNPAAALLTQSKRFPLVWDALRTALPTWRALLPETCDPRDAAWQGSDEWVLKPALGRVGEGVGLPGVTGAKEWKRIARDARRHPGHWVAQRRFAPTPFPVRGTEMHPCVGVYTVDARAAGAYGRLGRRPLIDWRAMDVAVLVADGAAPNGALGDHPNESRAGAAWVGGAAARTT